MTRASWLDILLLNKIFFTQGEDGRQDFMSIFWKPHSQVFPSFVCRGLQVKVVVCFLLLGAGRAVNVLVPYMYKIIGEFHYYFVLMILVWAKFGASPCEVYKLFCCTRRARLTCWSHSEAETRDANISIDLLGVRSWRHQVVTSHVWRSGQGSIFTDSKFRGSKFESRQSHTFKIWNFFLVFWSLFPPLLVSLYYHCWSFKASWEFCGNVFLVYF